MALSLKVHFCSPCMHLFISYLEGVQTGTCDFRSPYCSDSYGCSGQCSPSPSVTSELNKNTLSLTVLPETLIQWVEVGEEGWAGGEL
jgi:hypothetical protein